MDFLKEALYSLPAYHLGVMAGLLAAAPLVETTDQLEVLLSSVRDQLHPDVTGIVLLAFDQADRCLGVMGSGIPADWVRICSSEGLLPFSVISAEPVLWSHLDRKDRPGRMQSWAALARDYQQENGVTFSGVFLGCRIVLAASGSARIESGPVLSVLAHLWPAVRRLAGLLLCPQDRFGELDAIDVQIWTSVIDGLSYNDIAINMGMSRRTLTRRINRLLDNFDASTPEQLISKLLRP